jgi:hypothetical protein
MYLPKRGRPLTGCTGPSTFGKVHTVFNYCKIKFRPGSVPENTKENSPLVFTTLKMGSLKSALSFCKKAQEPEGFT